MLEAIFQYQFMRNAFIAGLLASVVCGIIGVIVIEKKLIMMSGGIAHAAYGGVGLGYLLGFEPIIGALLFSLSSALGVGAIKRKAQRADVAIALFWSLGMALGVFFTALAPGYPPNLSTYLFGNILSVTTSDLYMMAGLTLAVAFVIMAFYNDWKMYLFDEEFAFILKKRTVFLEFLLLCLIAMTVVVLIRVVGIILVLALLTAPGAIAGLFCRRLGGRMAAASAIGAVLCVSGLWASYELDIASGAAIVILSVVSYLAAYLIKKGVRRRG